MIELYPPAARGALMRSCIITERGVFRLSRRDCEVYSIMIVRNAWGRARLSNANGDGIWYQPSLFAGSFWLNASATGGLIFNNSSDQGEFQINFREQDRKTV